MNGIRLPSTFCWPTKAIICKIFVGFPLEPADTIFFKWFLGSKAFCTNFPASWPALLSCSFALYSKESTIFLPGCDSNFPIWALYKISLIFSLIFFNILATSSPVSESHMISLIPTVHPFNKRKLFIIFWQFPKNSIVFCGDTSVQILCTIPPLEAPTVFLQIIPWINSPFLIWTKLSIKLSLSANSSGVSSLNLVRFNFSGRIKLNICFPDHKGLGFIIQGIGKSLISKSSIHIIKLLTWS